jgi:DNA repair ATPase RecN
MTGEDALSDADTEVDEDRWDEGWNEQLQDAEARMDTIMQHQLAWHERMDALFEQWEAMEEQMDAHIEQQEQQMNAMGERLAAYRDPWTATWMPAVQDPHRITPLPASH